jgi:NADH:ubiquinone oxidoreductase subunit 3 (subunit A)
MSIGGSIALIVIGAIMKFAISWSPSYVNLQLVGVIVMLGGIVALIISLVFLTRRRRLVAGPPAEVYEERRYTDPPA